MSAGFVYILTNPSMPKLIKVGRTFRDSKARAKELHSTGVPTPFEVIFEIFSEEHEALEDKLHELIDDFRVAGNREFFRYPVERAIRDLQELSSPQTEASSTYSAVSVFHQLALKYPSWLNPAIFDVRIVQTKDRVWLEITEEKKIGGRLVDQIIKRSDLAFCVSNDFEGRYFSPDDPVSKNARKFVEKWGAYSIVMTTDLFHRAACQQIDNDPELNPHRKVKFDC